MLESAIFSSVLALLESEELLSSTFFKITCDRFIQSTTFFGQRCAFRVAKGRPGGPTGKQCADVKISKWIGVLRYLLFCSVCYRLLCLFAAIVLLTSILKNFAKLDGKNLKAAAKDLF